ncbi:MAG: fumarate hydratase, partial [Treponema sp.]|nr:fumarate hydratase [Treponema sp.]
GIGAQGLRGNKAVMGVHVETSARHTATLACAVNFSCYMLRRATVRLDNTLACKLDGFKGVTL